MDLGKEEKKDGRGRPIIVKSKLMIGDKDLERILYKAILLFNGFTVDRFSKELGITLSSGSNFLNRNFTSIKTIRKLESLAKKPQFKKTLQTLNNLTKQIY